MCWRLREVCRTSGRPERNPEETVWPNQIGGHLYASPPARKGAPGGAPLRAYGRDRNYRAVACILSTQREYFAGCNRRRVGQQYSTQMRSRGRLLKLRLIRESVVNAPTNAAIRSALLKTYLLRIKRLLSDCSRLCRHRPGGTEGQGLKHHRFWP